MSRRFLIFIFVYLSLQQLNAQRNTLKIELDSLLSIPSEQPFNGVILIAKNDTIIYSKKKGYSNIEKKRFIKSDDQFIIGSISKQFTAVLVLREFDKGHLQLHLPIRYYLPELKQAWADTVTVHHLLTHTHGIPEKDGNKSTFELSEHLLFKPGSAYSYSQIGFHLLALITEKTSGQSFPKLSAELFKTCGMKNTMHPALKTCRHLVNGYSETKDGKLAIDSNGFINYVAAGCFISNASDLLRWNNLLFKGQLLSDSSFKMMTTPQPNAIRQHPLFGKTLYGYGITTVSKNQPIQWGQTGLAPGYCSINYFYPKNNISFIILQNTVWDKSGLSGIFKYHLNLLGLLKKQVL